MTKKDFIRQINDSLKSLTLKQKVEILTKMRNKWIPELIEKMTKNYVQCDQCKEYSLKKSCQHITKTEIRTEAIYIDTGYGDDDEYGEVEYIVEYQVCPICGHEEEVRKTYIGRVDKVK